MNFGPKVADMDGQRESGTPYTDKPSVQHLHRSLGAFVTMYSEIISTMRHGIEEFLSPVDDEGFGDRSLFHILFAGMTAKPITDAFFGMATFAAQLDTDEIRIRNTLKRRWEEQTTFRNDIAHAEWSMGWETMDGEEVPPASIRIKHVEGVPTLTNLRIDGNEVGTRINQIQIARPAMAAFGSVCRSRQRGYSPKLGDYLEIVPAQGASPAYVRAIEDAPSLWKLEKEKPGER